MAGSTQLIGCEIDLRKMAASCGATMREVKAAAASAINKTLMKERTQVTREVAQEAKVAPQRLVRRRMKLDRAKANHLVGTLRVLTTDISVAKLQGTVDTGEVERSSRRNWGDQIAGTRLRRQLGQGVKAYGGRQYPHAFLAHSKGGILLAFERRGKSRLPVNVLKVPIHKVAEAIIARRQGMAGAGFRALWEKDVQWRVSKRVK